MINRKGPQTHNQITSNNTKPLAEWSGLKVTFLRVVGLIPNQWTSTYLLVGGSWLYKLLRPPGLVDTIGRWENGPACAKLRCIRVES
jgi:hypothetical protein